MSKDGEGEMIGSVWMALDNIPGDSAFIEKIRPLIEDVWREGRDYGRENPLTPNQNAELLVLIKRGLHQADSSLVNEDFRQGALDTIRALVEQIRKFEERT